MNPIIPFITALALSAIAGYYSIVGLALIFSGSFLPIVIMGITLEIAKLVTTAWLYRNWKVAPILLKIYFTCAIIILMLITSMGIFGYLSKSHIDVNLNINANSIELRSLENEEKLINSRLEYLLKIANDSKQITRQLDYNIKINQNRLREISKEKLPYLKEENRNMAEIGPIRYIAEFLYGENDVKFIDKSVRIIIFIIIFVFDPLAILLLIASNINSVKSNYLLNSKYSVRIPKNRIAEINK